MKKLATNRKLGRTTDIRMAMLKTMTTDLIYHGKIETTLPRAKEVKAIADSIISLAIKEKDNYEMVDVKVVKAKLDSKGNKMTELVKSKNGKEYLKVVKEETTEKRQKDMPSRLNARRKIMRKRQGRQQQKRKKTANCFIVLFLRKTAGLCCSPAKKLCCWMCAHLMNMRIVTYPTVKTSRQIH